MASMEDGRYFINIQYKKSKADELMHIHISV